MGARKETSSKKLNKNRNEKFIVAFISSLLVLKGYKKKKKPT